MERDDSEQEGVTLNPRMATRLIAEAAARQVVIEHIGLCPFSKVDVERRLREIETNYARLIGFMIGSGILGGAAGAIVSKIWPH